MTYLNRAYDVLNNLGLSRLHPEDRNDIAVAFSEVLEEVEAAALGRAARYLRSAADLIDTLLAQALGLVSEDRRTELADAIEQIITQAQAMPQKVYTLAIDNEPTGIVGVFADLETLKTVAFSMGFRYAEIAEFVIEKGDGSGLGGK